MTIFSIVKPKLSLWLLLGTRACYPRKLAGTCWDVGGFLGMRCEIS